MKRWMFLAVCVLAGRAFAFPTDTTILDEHTPIRATCLTTTNASADIDTVTPTTVNGDSVSGQKVLNVAATTDSVAGDWVSINAGGARWEIARIASVQAGTSFTMVSNLLYTHTAVQADAVRRTNRIGPMTSGYMYELVCTDATGGPVGCYYTVGTTYADASRVVAAILPAGLVTNFYAMDSDLYLSVIPFANDRKAILCPRH